MLIILSKGVGLGGLLTLFVIPASGLRVKRSLDQSTLQVEGSNLRGLNNQRNKGSESADLPY